MESALAVPSAQKHKKLPFCARLAEKQLDKRKQIANGKY
jgi:hypothetical protein